MITYNLAIEVVLLNHDDINCLGIFECQETKSSGAASGAVAHDCAFENLAELGEVVFEGFCCLPLVI